MKKCFIYARSSAYQQTKDGTSSIEIQVEQLKQLARKKNLKVDRVFIDRCSACSKNMPAFFQLLKEVLLGRVTTIVCQDITRFNGNTCDWYLQHLFKKEGVRVITPQLEEGPGKLIEGILSVVNEYDREFGSYRIKHGIASRKARQNQKEMLEKVSTAKLHHKKQKKL